YVVFVCDCRGDGVYLHSFPTRRSSDLRKSTSMVAFIATICGSRETMRGSLVYSTGWNSTPGLSATKSYNRCVPIALVVTILLRRSEEHTSELQSRGHLVCRLLLEKKKE